MRISSKTSLNKIKVSQVFRLVNVTLILIFVFVSKIQAYENYQESNNLSALSESEKIDPSFTPAIGFAGRILTAARQSDGKLIVGGIINNANGVPHSNLARFLENLSFQVTFHRLTDLLEIK